jgi:hypothetical protein
VGVVWEFTMSMTIAELARDLSVPVAQVKSFLRQYGTTGEDYRPVDKRLSADDESLVREAHARAELSVTRAKAGDVADTDDHDDENNAPPTVAEVAVAPRVALPTVLGRSARKVLVHQSVLEWVDHDHPPSARRSLTRALIEMMERGFAKNSKGVKGKNAGWRRTPFGGSGGMQFYLWYCDASSEPARGQTEPDTLYVRAVRHHDETSTPLDLGSLDDYAPVQPRELVAAEETSDWLDPLSPVQREAVRSGEGAVILQGHPGAGKTTALQHMLPYLQGDVLYLTFSQALLQRAENWWRAFGSSEATLHFRTFAQLVTELTGMAPPSEECRRQVEDRVVGEITRRGGQLGPWLREGTLHRTELLAEMHAYLFGSALPVAFRGRAPCQSPRLSDRDYLALRSSQLGEAAARGVLRAGSKVDDDDVATMFAAPGRAFAALTHVATQGLGAHGDYRAIVVDEVQDLTLTELYLLIDVAVRITQATGVKPRLMLAGDESQTVQATGFAWGTLNDLVHRRLGDRVEKVLPGNVRSPADLAAVIANSWRIVYGNLGKDFKPRGSVTGETDESTTGRVMRVCADTPEARRALVERFAAVPDSALVVAAPEVPAAWREAAEGLTTVFTADLAKGLEFRAVGVLDAGAALLAQRALAGDRSHRLHAEFARVSADRIRVALSRPTGTLVLVDGEPRPEVAAVLDELCAGEDGPLEGDLGAVTVASLEEHLEADAADALAAILEVMDNVESLVERSPKDALQMLVTNRGRLGRRGAHGALPASQRLRYFGLLGVCAVTSAAREPDPAKARDLLQSANRNFRDANNAPCEEAAKLLARCAAPESAWTTERLNDVKALAEAIPRAIAAEPRLKGFLLDTARKELRQFGSGPIPTTRPGLERALAALDALSGVLDTGRPKIATAVASGRTRIFDEALAHRHFGVAESVLRALGPVDAHLEAWGRLYETRGPATEAATFYQERGRVDDALRVLRKAGEVEAACEVARGASHPAAAVLGWWVETRAQLARRPPGALEDTEREALEKALRAALVWPPPAPAS